MLSRFFIDRPIFAWVVAIIIMMFGLVAITRLPISRYPNIAPPSVAITASYPGASAQTVEDSVTQIIEQNMTGLDGLIYMVSTSDNNGNVAIILTFASGTNADIAQVQAQNKLQQAVPLLPQIVQQQGISVSKSNRNFLIAVGFVSADGKMSEGDIGDYLATNVVDPMSRVEGVGGVQLFGAKYAMRIWLDPGKLDTYHVTAADVIAAIQAQNAQVAVGQLGDLPAVPGQQLNATITALGRMHSPEEFSNIVLRGNTDGSTLHLSDVARIELGQADYGVAVRYNGKPASGMGVILATGANALRTVANVQDLIHRLEPEFPPGLKASFPYDTTPFVRKSIEEVIKTLAEAILLVFLVMYLFLQNIRATLIPTVAVPVVLLGTFGVLQLAGYSINMLTMFAVVLAIGLLVDDAIVVVENVERNIANGLAPLDATRQAMKEVTGPIIATALVLCAVFVPTAFITGLSGQFYKQFALTIAISTVISAFNSLSLSPALSALLLKSHDAPPDRFSRLLNSLFGWLFRPFNRLFARASNGYVSTVGRVLRAGSIALFVYAGLLGLTWLGFAHTPTGFVPPQDKQYLVAYAQLPDAATLDRTESVIRRMSSTALATPGVESVPAFPGLSINGFTNATNAGIAFTPLKPFEQRRTADLSASAIAATLRAQYSKIQDAYIAVFPPPPVQGLGTIGGFKLQVEDRGNLGPDELYRQTQNLIAKARQRPELAGLFSGFQVNVPQVQVDVDREKAKAAGVALQDLYDTMQVYLGALYVNDFNRFGRTYQVNAQAEPNFRLTPEDIGRLKTRNLRGDMIPLSSFVSVRETSGPDRVMHYNGYTAADINGGPAPGYSSGQAQKAMEEVARAELPNGMTFEWTDLTFQQILAGNSMVFVFPLVVLLVFIVLAALYESLSLPLVVILIVPMCLFSAIVGVQLAGSDNNIFTQIGLIVLVGLACKNAILIVEFARDRELAGESTWQAVLDACRLRLRPILMTSLAFVMGVVPLVTSHGAGAEMRHAMGVAVFSGMLGVTFFGLLLTPVFYLAVSKLKSARRGRVAGATLILATGDIS